MTSSTSDAALRGWLDATAEAPIAPPTRSRALAGLAEGRPRAAVVAAIGSHWPTEVGAAAAPWHAIRRTLARRALAVAVALLLGGATIIAGLGLLTKPTSANRPVLYERDGDLVLMRTDGTDAVAVADGAPAADPHGTWYTFVGGPWSPDGSHFAYHELRPWQVPWVVTHIAEPSGAMVASFEIEPASPGATSPLTPRPGAWRVAKSTFNVQWSPDSMLLATSPWSDNAVTVWGLDGKVRARLPFPPGYSGWREFYHRWAPDGRAMIVSISGNGGALTAREVWRLPLDGSVAERVADDDPRTRWDVAVSPDGRRIAYSGLQNLDLAGPIYVANADGTNPRELPTTRHDYWTSSWPRWSPDGARLAYLVGLADLRFELHVVDVSTGVDTFVVQVLDDGSINFDWSPNGDLLLIRALDVGHQVDGPVPGGPVVTDLYSVLPDGSGLRVLVEDVEGFGVPS